MARTSPFRNAISIEKSTIAIKNQSKKLKSDRFIGARSRDPPLRTHLQSPADRSHASTVETLPDISVECQTQRSAEAQVRAPVYSIRWIPDSRVHIAYRSSAADRPARNPPPASNGMSPE